MSRARGWLSGLVLLPLMAIQAEASLEAAPLHREVLVFVPAYEACQLFDPTLDAAGETSPCVWGNYNVFLSSKLYFALRMPNPLVPRTMLAVGPLDVYRKFVATLTAKPESGSGFSPYTEGSDFFIFDYDWRQEIATVSAPQLGRALEEYARIHERKTGIPAGETKFIIVTHSMGGLVARTLLSEQPALAARISRMYLVGSANAGSVKATRTVVVGPDSIKQHARGFPGFLLNLLPSDVDQNVTKLTGITRPSLYELLPTFDPSWTVVQPDGSRRQMGEAAMLRVDSWSDYWPSAALEKRLFIDGWLHNREREGRKQIDPAQWEFCQDPEHAKLRGLLEQTASWRRLMGRLSGTDRLLTGTAGKSRLRIILSTGLKTPTAVVTRGAHDHSDGQYIYGNEGDGTMEARRVLDDVPADAPNVVGLHDVAHGRLMIDAQFLQYFIKELSGRPLIDAGSSRPSS